MNGEVTHQAQVKCNHDNVESLKQENEVLEI